MEIVALVNRKISSFQDKRKSRSARWKMPICEKAMENVALLDGKSLS